MQIGTKEEMTMAQACQWAVEHMKAVQDRYGISFTKGVQLFVDPIDEEGTPVIAREPDGRPVQRLRSGRYKSSTEDFAI